MSKEREALKQALEALEVINSSDDDRDFLHSDECEALWVAIDTIREALAEQLAHHDLKPKFVRNVDGVPCITLVEHEHLLLSRSKPAQQQEPVAVYVGETWCGSVVRLYEDLPLETPLYTSPQQHIEHCIWSRSGNRPCPHVQPSKPLTDEQIERCMKQAYATAQGRNLEHAFARAIEAAHGIKGDA